MHLVGKRLALLLAHGVPLLGAPVIDGALDLEHRVETFHRGHRGMKTFGAGDL